MLLLTPWGANFHCSPHRLVKQFPALHPSRLESQHGNFMADMQIIEANPAFQYICTYIYAACTVYEYITMNHKWKCLGFRHSHTCVRRKFKSEVTSSRGKWHQPKGFAFKSPSKNISLFTNDQRARVLRVKPFYIRWCLKNTLCFGKHSCANPEIFAKKKSSATVCTSAASSCDAWAPTSPLSSRGWEFLQSRSLKFSSVICWAIFCSPQKRSVT